MFRFLKNIRKEMAEKKKVSSYLKYAIGEIALVVIGILIALQIGIWNEKREDKLAVDEILKEMQIDLLNDISEANKLTRWTEFQDSIAKNMINSVYSEKDYRDSTKQYLFSVGTDTYPLIVSDMAFNRLTGFSGTISSDQKEILRDVNQIYREEKAYIDELYERLNSFTIKYNNEKYLKYPWLNDLANDNVTDEIVDYYLNDKLFKNYLRRYKDLAYVLGAENVRRFRYKSMLLYLRIEQLIGNDEVPDSLNKFAKLNNKENLSEFIGKYKKPNEEGDLEIVIKNDKIFMSGYQMICIAKDTLQYIDYYKENVLFKRNNEGKINASIINWNDQLFEYHKIE